MSFDSSYNFEVEAINVVRLSTLVMHPGHLTLLLQESSPVPPILLKLEKINHEWPIVSQLVTLR